MKRTSLILPSELLAFALKRAKEMSKKEGLTKPNLSAYVRTLIVSEKERQSAS